MKELFIPYSELKFIFTQDNLYRASRRLGHVATPMELVDWYIQNMPHQHQFAERRKEMCWVQEMFPHAHTW